MFRQSLLWLSEQQGVFNFVRKNQMARSFASRFVAGESVDDAVAAAVELDRQGMLTTLDLLGESVNRPEAASAAKDEYLGMLDRLEAANLEANVSVKLTQMGLDIDEELCAHNLMSIVERGAPPGTTRRRPAAAGTARPAPAWARRSTPRRRWAPTRWPTAPPG